MWRLIRSTPLRRVGWLQGLADTANNKGHPHGIVAYTDLSKSGAPEMLERLATFKNERGIRQILNTHADPRNNYVARRNTTLKLSGFAMFDHRWTVESFRPYVLEAIDAFGTGRCLFASNFPIDRLHATTVQYGRRHERQRAARTCS